MKNTNFQLSLYEEIALCLSIVDKFNEALRDCQKDYETLTKLKEVDGDNPDWKAAFKANQQRTEDVKITLHLVTKRINDLTNQALKEDDKEGVPDKFEDDSGDKEPSLAELIQTFDDFSDPEDESDESKEPYCIYTDELDIDKLLSD